MHTVNCITLLAGVIICELQKVPAMPSERSTVTISNLKRLAKDHTHHRVKANPFTLDSLTIMNSRCKKVHNAMRKHFSSNQSYSSLIFGCGFISQANRWESWDGKLGQEASHSDRPEPPRRIKKGDGHCLLHCADAQLWVILLGLHSHWPLIVLFLGPTGIMGKYVKSQFGSAENAGAYHVYMDMLETIKTNKPKAYHRLMADLYWATLWVFTRSLSLTNSGFKRVNWQPSCR